MSGEPQFHFEPSFFDTEIREGFTVTGLMKRAWAAQMEVLAVIDNICKKYQLTWFADSGTLLGAIRHKGFIPWDDDMDIAMKRDDYNKLMEVISKELPEGYIYFGPVVSNVASDISPSFFLRIANSKGLRFGAEHLHRYHGFPYSSGIDIFPIDGMPDDSEERELLYNIIKIILNIDIKYEELDETGRENALKSVEELCAVSLSRDQNIHKQLMVLVDALSRTYSVDECDELCVIGWHCMDIDKPMKKEYYSQSVELPFETISISVPARYHEVAQAQYGDNYMIPMKKTASHDYPFWKVQKKDAYDKLDRKGYEKRERYVADTMGVDISEVFEISLLQNDNNRLQWQYFCQGDIITVEIPIEM